MDGSYPKFDGGGQIMKMDHGTYYCDFSQWDTYRAAHPLFSILNPSRNGDMTHSLVLKGQQGGWLPIFPSWNSYTAAMIGDHCIAMIGDAIIKDAPGFDYEEAYMLMRKKRLRGQSGLRQLSRRERPPGNGVLPEIQLRTVRGSSNGSIPPP